MKKIKFVILMFAFCLSISAQAFAGIPAVSTTSPANGDTGVNVMSPVTITFNEAILWGSLYNTGVYKIKIYEVGPETLFSAYVFTPEDNSASYVLAPTSAFKANTQYRVEVLPGLLSQSTEEVMTLPYQFVFTTEVLVDATPPVVNSVYPDTGAISIPLDTLVRVWFSEPMDAGYITDSYLKLYNLTDGTYVSVVVSYDTTTNSAVIEPSSPLQKSKEYRIEVSGVKDLAGNTLAATYQATFKTILADTTPPTIVSTTPYNTQTGVVSSVVEITFSEPMDPTTLTTSTIILKQGATTIAGSVGYDTVTNKATFVAVTSLALATDYTVTVTSGVRDLAGNYMSANKVFTFTTMQATTPPAMSSYSQIPPFVAGSSAQPNLLLMIDNSGSMAEQAYYDNYNSGKSYYGYFDNTKMYSYNSTNKRYEASGVTLDLTSTASGNFLNWLVTRRIDAVRMVLVGGLSNYNDNIRTYYATSDSFQKIHNGVKYVISESSSKPLIRKCTNASCSTRVDTFAVVYVTNAERDANLGLIHQFKDKMRIGIEFFNGGYKYESGGSRDGGYIQVDIGQTGVDFANQVMSTDPSTWTPLAESLYESIRYFKTTTSAYNNGNYNGKNPIINHCSRSFVLILTDGESTMDRNLPSGYWSGTTSSVSDTNFSVKDYLDQIKAVEGWTSNRWSTTLNGSGGTWYLPSVAYYAHKNDLRSDLDGTQNLTVYTVFAFDDSASAKELLKLTAKYGGFEDTDGSGKPDETAKWDKDGDGDPDTYYQADDGAALQTSLEKAFNDILAKVSSGTAASILNNSEGSGANLLQAVFYPKKTFDAGTEVSWIGEMQNLWYYFDPYLKNSTIRVDSTADNTLNLLNDKVAQFVFDPTTQQTVVKLADDTDGDGDADSSWTSFSPDNTTYVKSLWRAGRQLWERNLTTSPRTIYTRTNGLVDAGGNQLDNSSSGLALFNYDSQITQNAFFQNMLQVANTTEANKLVKYIHGVAYTDASGNTIDSIGYRSRLAKIGSTTGIWRLGDVVSSTPKLLANVALNIYAADPPSGYADSSYSQFVNSEVYKNRGMVFVGANDGMLHAFKLGKLEMINNNSSQKARLTGSDFGKEEWAFIPRNILPYLRYFADPAYSHLFYVDGTTLLSDVAINAPTDNDAALHPGCTAAHYWKCGKKTVYSNTSTKALDMDKTSWRTVLIGSTGLGGAGRNRLNSGYCYDKTGSNCVKTPVDGTGYSSYYALDVTDPANPKFLWEFNGDPSAGTNADQKGGDLGYATTGPLIIRVGDKTKNGRWFAVFGSGPTGPIDSSIKQFKGNSDQPLKLFVVDIGTGKLVTTIDTGITEAFAGSVNNSSIDTDRSKPYAPGFYSDDAFYVGYTQKTGSTSNWFSGGVGRVLTKESVYPDHTKDTDDPAIKDAANNWIFSKVFEDSSVGPITSAVSKLQDRNNKQLWLYFGSGRYYFKSETDVDDPDSQRRLYAVLDPCYSNITNDIDQGCTASTITTSELQNQTTISTYNTTNKGWYINLPITSGTAKSERLITNPVATSTGVVFFTTFQPKADVCSYGGSARIWATDYKTGGLPSNRAMEGKILLQVSTGAFVEKDLASWGPDRASAPVAGVPPKDEGFKVFGRHKSTPRVLHIQEK